MTRTTTTARITATGLATLASAALLFGAATPAAAADAAPEFLTSGTVTVEEDTNGEWLAPGTTFFSVDILIPDDVFDYATMWERESGTWADTAEFTEYLKTDYVTWADCRMEGARQLVADSGVQTNDEFLDTFGTGEGTYWDFTTDEWDSIANGCPPREWNWNNVSQSWDSGTKTLTARIPLDLIGPGTHELWLQPLESSCSETPDGTVEATCVVVTLDDVQTTLVDTRLAPAGAAVTTTITVPNADGAVEATADPSEDPSATEDPRDEPQAVESQEPAASGSGASWGLVGLIVGVGVLLLIGLMVLIFVLARRSGKKADQAGVAPGFAAPGYGAPEVPQAPSGWPTQAPVTQAYPAATQAYPAATQATQAYPDPTQAQPAPQWPTQAQPTQAYPAPGYPDATQTQPTQAYPDPTQAQPAPQWPAHPTQAQPSPQWPAQPTPPQPTAADSAQAGAGSAAAGPAAPTAQWPDQAPAAAPAVPPYATPAQANPAPQWPVTPQSAPTEQPPTAQWPVTPQSAPTEQPPTAQWPTSEHQPAAPTAPWPGYVQPVSADQWPPSAPITPIAPAAPIAPIPPSTPAERWPSPGAPSDSAPTAGDPAVDFGDSAPTNGEPAIQFGDTPAPRPESEGDTPRMPDTPTWRTDEDQH